MATAAQTRVPRTPGVPGNCSPEPRPSIEPRHLLGYWHLLSLDAPTVAALWCYTLCRAAHVQVSSAAIMIIASGTWLLYVSDRILDGINPADPRKLRERHHFHRKYRRAFGTAAAGVACLATWLALTHLPGRMLVDFSVVLLAALGHFGLVHSGRLKGWFPKELAVGIIFAAAVAVPAWVQLPWVNRPALALGVALVAALFWLNCMAIECWETLPVNAVLTFRESSRVSRAACTVMAAAILSSLLQRFAPSPGPLSFGLGTPFFSSILISAAILFLLDRLALDRLAIGGKRRPAWTGLSPLHLRIAADLALLSPLLLLAISRL